MKIFNDVRSRSPLGEVGQKPVDTPLLAAGSRAFERIVFIISKVVNESLCSKFDRETGLRMKES